MILSWVNEVVIKNNWFFVHVTLKLEVNKKTEKLRKLEKNNWKNRTIKKKPIKILKKLTGSVRFYKPKTEKKLEKNWDKPEKNRIKLKKPNKKKMHLRTNFIGDSISTLWCVLIATPWEFTRDWTRPGLLFRASKNTNSRNDTAWLKW